MPQRPEKPLIVRVLIVSQYFWPENFRVNDVAADFVARGHAVTVLTGLPNYPSGRFFPGYSWRGPWLEEYAGAKVVRVPLLPRRESSRRRYAEAQFDRERLFDCLEEWSNEVVQKEREAYDGKEGFV